MTPTLKFLDQVEKKTPKKEETNIAHCMDEKK